MSSMTKSKIRAARLIVACGIAVILTIGGSMVALALVGWN